METDNLKSLWKSIQSEEIKGFASPEINMDAVIQEEHGKVMTKMLCGARNELIISSALLVVWVGLLLYAYGYLNLHFSTLTNAMFGMITLFLLFTLFMGVNKYYVIRAENNTSTIKDSFLSFRKKWRRVNMLYLIALTCYLYLLVARIIFGISKEFKGMYQSGMFFPIILIIFLTLGIPWLLRLAFKHRFKKLFKNLDESMRALDHEAD